MVSLFSFIILAIICLIVLAFVLVGAMMVLIPLGVLIAAPFIAIYSSITK